MYVAVNPKLECFIFFLNILSKDFQPLLSIKAIDLARIDVVIDLARKSYCRSVDYF